jgi:hypothetical protein
MHRSTIQTTPVVVAQHQISKLNLFTAECEDLSGGFDRLLEEQIAEGAIIRAAFLTLVRRLLVQHIATN